MFKKITTCFILLTIQSIITFGFNTDLNTCSSPEFSNTCLSFVFIPSDYNGQVISCPEALDGSLALNVFGGNEPYNYQWEDGTFGFQRNNLGAGTYSVTITDFN
jgi:hypothetical protein